MTKTRLVPSSFSVKLAADQMSISTMTDGSEAPGWPVKTQVPPSSWPVVHAVAI